MNLLKLKSSSSPIVSARALLAMNSSCSLDCSRSLRELRGGPRNASYSADIAMFTISPILKENELILSLKIQMIFTSPDIVIFEIVRLLFFASLRLPLLKIIILMMNLLLFLLMPAWQIHVDSDIWFPLVSIGCCLTGIIRISGKEKNTFKKILVDIGPVLFIRP